MSDSRSVGPGAVDLSRVGWSVTQEQLVELADRAGCSVGTVGRRLLGLPVQPHKLRTRLDAVIGAVTRTPVQLADPLISLRARLQERLQDLHETSDGVDGLRIALEEVERALERARHPHLTTDVPPQVAT